MTKKQDDYFKIRKEQSEIRQRLGVIGLMEGAERTAEVWDEQLTLRQRQLVVEGELQKAYDEQRAEQEKAVTVIDSPENRELCQLETSSSIGEIAAGVLSSHPCDGATREYQQALHLKPNQIPLALMRSPLVEERSSGITPGPASAGADQRPIIPAVFPSSVAAFLGITGQTVDVGEAAFAVVSTSATPGAPAEGADQAHSTAAFESASLSPTRLQASLFFSVEDAARIMGLSDALRMNLSDALSDELDDQILTNSTNGLFSGANLADHDASAVGTFVTLKKRVVYDAIDGKYANNAGDLRVVLGAASYALMGSVYRGNNSDVDALESIMGKVAGVRVSSHVPAVGSSKQELIVARGTAQHVAVALWQGIDLIEDPYSMAKSGEVILTARLLHAIKILRKDGFRKVELQHA